MTISCTLSWAFSAVTSSSRWLVIGLVSLHLTSQVALSQRSSATCTTEWKWTNNKAAESPCDVAAQLLSLCDSNPSSFQLPSGVRYMPSSSSPIQANTCSCNVVAYNLLMACQACQKGSATNSILTWEQYGKSCGICSTENGISPGPCHEQSNPGFPGTVRPNRGSIGVPLWALENTSGSSWNVAAARKIASAGQEKTISAPTSANPSDKDSGDEKSNKTNSNKEAFAPGNERMKGAVIACVCLAALILTGFIAYLLRICYNKRKMKKLKAFNDSAFDKVIPTKKESSSEKFGGSGLAAPLKLNLKNMMARITEAVPRTPRTPRTPGMADPPSTPLTARFWAFRKSDTKKLKIITEGDETEALAEKSVRFQQEGGNDNLRRKTLSRRCDSVASCYSDFDSYKTASSQTSSSRPGSMASVASSKGTITTGSVKVERPKLREPSRGVSVQSLKVAVVEPSRPNSQASIQSSEVAPSARAGGRITGQHAKVSELGDRVAHTSRGSLESTGRSVKVRSSSMSEVETGSLTGNERESRQKASIRSRSNSQIRASSIRASSSVGDEEEALNQRATDELPEELKLKQREVAARISVASSAPSSTMEHSTSRMKKLFESASDNARLSVSSEAEKLDDTKARASVATVSSNSSNLRRLDSVIGQLEFDEMMSSYGSPTKKSWLARMSTKSGRSVPPPSPAFSTAPGVAM